MKDEEILYNVDEDYYRTATGTFGYKKISKQETKETSKPMALENLLLLFVLCNVSGSFDQRSQGSKRF